jgi:serine protease
MKRCLLLLSTLVFALTIVGCGGGGGGDSTDPGNGIGAIQGTVSFYEVASIAEDQDINGKDNSPVAPLLTIPLYRQQSVSNEKIIKFRSGLSDADAAKIVSGFGGTIKQKLYGTESTYVISISLSNNSLSSLNQNSKVEYTEDNSYVHACATVTPNDTYYITTYNWGYKMINMPTAWGEQKGDPSVIVAVVDSGVSLTHPDLAGNLVAGYDFVDNDTTPSDTTYYDADHRYSHGTHVSGTISAVTNNNLGIAGVGWNVKIMPVRVLGNDGSGTTADVSQGIRWAADHGANIINLSLGGRATTIPTTQKEAIDYAIAKGVTVIAATGNDGSYVSSPANYDPVIAVAAVDKSGTRASYSNYGSQVDIAAPGGGGTTSTNYIYSTTYDKKTGQNTYSWLQGTSMATPHVSGVAALLYSRGITTPSAITSRLKSTATSLGSTNYYGSGLVNAYAALKGLPYDVSKAKVYYYKLPDTTTQSSFITVASDGSYSISDLNAGTYKICAFFDKDYDGAVSSGDLLGSVDSVTVKANKTTTVNIAITGTVD